MPRKDKRKEVERLLYLISNAEEYEVAKAAAERILQIFDEVVEENAEKS